MRTFTILAATAGVASGAELQASTATHLLNAHFGTTRTSSYTGLNYVDFGSLPGIKDNGGEARWVYHAAHPGNHEVCTVHAGAMPKAKLLVNSALLKEAVDVVMQPTGAWTTWSTTCVNVDLSKGTNKLTLHSDTGNAIVDKLTVQYRPVVTAAPEADGTHICGHTTCEMKNGMMMVRTTPHSTSQVLYEGKGHQTEAHHCMYFQAHQSCRCYCRATATALATDAVHNAKLAADRALRPVDGHYAAWSDWSACAPKSFGEPPVTHRTRSCTNPAPVGTGKTCEGADYEEASCTHQSHNMS